LIFASGGIFGAFTGAKLVNLMTTEQLKTSFGIYSILIAMILLRNNWRNSRAEANGTELPEGSQLKKLGMGSLFGYLSGLVTGIFGTTGTAPVMAGLFALQMPLKLVLGTSLLIVSVNMISAFGAHFLVGEVDLTLVYFLTAGTIVGALIGPSFLAGLRFGQSEGPIKYWYAIGMILFGILMIIK
jgi:uncharacterized membrane protein YfcA